MQDLRGKVAFITGGSRGIGLGIARAMLAAGMKVAIAARNVEHLTSAAAVLGGRKGGALHAVSVDVMDRDGVLRAADEVQRVFGKIHVLCNNAGAGIKVRVAEATRNDWDWAIGVNVYGVIHGLQAFLPKILAHGEGGHVVSTASMAGLFVGATAGVYSATKFAVVGMMEALRSELAPHGIGVSVYCPGVVSTRFHESEDSRPAIYAEPGRTLSDEQRARFEARVLPAGMDPREAGARVLDGIRRNDLYVLTHPEYEPGLRERFEALLAAMPKDAEAPPERVAVERAIGLLSNPSYVAERDRRLAERG